MMMSARTLPTSNFQQLQAIQTRPHIESKEMQIESVVTLQSLSKTLPTPNGKAIICQSRLLLDPIRKLQKFEVFCIY